MLNSSINSAEDILIQFIVRLLVRCYCCLFRHWVVLKSHIAKENTQSPKNTCTKARRKEWLQAFPKPWCFRLPTSSSPAHFKCIFIPTLMMFLSVKDRENYQHFYSSPYLHSKIWYMHCADEMHKGKRFMPIVWHWLHLFSNVSFFLNL